MDIVTANIGEPNVIYFGSESKSYERKMVFDTSTDQSYSVSVDDMDMDGNIDIIVGNVGAPNTVFINNGKGANWKKVTLSDKKFSTYDILSRDLNGDKMPDIIESNSDELNLYYFNRIDMNLSFRKSPPQPYLIIIETKRLT